MKKHIVLFITTTLLFTFTSIFYACTQEDPIEDLEQITDLGNFEADLQAVFNIANQNMELVKSGRKWNPEVTFLNAVTQVFPGSTTEESFQTNYVLATSSNPNGIQKDIAPTDLELLIKRFEDEAQGIQILNDNINSNEFSVEQKQQFIVLRESIKFFSQNNNVLSEYINHSRAQNNKVIPKCGWWKSWGKCVAGTLGGLGTGAAAGCWAGGSSGVYAGPTGIGVGCTAGAVAGGIFGALTGAASSCDGCEN